MCGTRGAAATRARDGGARAISHCHGHAAARHAPTLRVQLCARALAYILSAIPLAQTQMQEKTVEACAQGGWCTKKTTECACSNEKYARMHAHVWIPGFQTELAVALHVCEGVSVPTAIRVRRMTTSPPGESLLSNPPPLPPLSVQVQSWKSHWGPKCDDIPPPVHFSRAAPPQVCGMMPCAHTGLSETVER